MTVSKNGASTKSRATFNFEWYPGRPNTPGVELHSETRDPRKNKDLLAEVEGLTRQVERESGGERVMVDRQRSGKGARLYMEKEAPDLSGESLRRRAVDRMAVLCRVVEPRIGRLRQLAG